MANSKIAHMTIFCFDKITKCLYIENQIILLTLYKNIIIGLSYASLLNIALCV